LGAGSLIDSGTRTVCTVSKSSCREGRTQMTNATVPQALVP